MLSRRSLGSGRYWWSWSDSSPSTPSFARTSFRRIPSARRPLASCCNENLTEPEHDMGLLENGELEKELEMRSAERDEMLRRIKTLTDKHQSVRDALKREESIKRHQLLIMKKTHETQLEIKNSLIRNLEDIIDEQEARIFNLENHLAGIRGLSPNTCRPLAGVTRLVTQMDELTAKNVQLTEQVATLEQETEALGEELSQHKERFKRMESTAQTYGRTDNEKQIGKLEERVSEYVKEIEALKIENLKLKTTVNCQCGAKDDRFAREEVVAVAGGTAADKGYLDQISNLELQNAALQVEIARLRQEIAALIEKPTQNIQSNHDGEVVEKLRAETFDLRSQLTALRSELENSQHLAHSQKQKIFHLESEVANACKQISTQSTESDTKVKKLQDTLSRLKRQSETWENRQADTIIALDCFRGSLRALREEQADLYKAAAMLPAQITQEMVACKQQVIRYSSMCVQELVGRYKREMALRKKYHNELVELKGNIRVFCRVRPPIALDVDQTSIVECDRDDDTMISVQSNGRTQVFTLDRVFGPATSQREVFGEVRDFVTSCIDGYHVCIFAYGQTGSGKTHTMEGSEEDPGINNRALITLFEEAGSRAPDWTYTISVSMLEIYNEMIRDLLSDDPGTYKLDVKLHVDGGLHVPGLTTVEVHSADDVRRVFRRGHNNRATATTNMNEHSSRSHALLCVTIAGYNHSTKVRSLGKLNLVDLAGSERVGKSAASGERLKEAQCINKSLSSLGDVIWALRNKQNHVPFRNSKLTYLLQDSLSGDSKTLMVVQVAPVACHNSETICSLNFGQRVRTVELGTPSAKLTTAAANGNGQDSSSEEGHTSPLQRSPSKNYKNKTPTAWR